MLMTLVGLTVECRAVEADDARLPLRLWWKVKQLMLMMLAGLGHVPECAAADVDDARWCGLVMECGETHADDARWSRAGGGRWGS